jgi:hypothetical protein
MSLEGVIDSLYEDGILSTEATQIEPKSIYEGESALFAEILDYGHSNYTAIRIEDDLLYLVSLSFGMGIGYTPASLYDSAGEFIDSFLMDVFEINLEKRYTISAHSGTDQGISLFRGETSQGEKFSFKVEKGEITALEVAFDIPGCKSYSPYAQLYVNYPITENTISIININLEITGTFDSPNNASGTMRIHPAICDGEVDATWSASTNLLPPIMNIQEVVLPEMEIPEGLFNPEAGDEKFYQSGIESQGDWYLYNSALESMLPIPAGWSTNETGNETHIMFFEKGRPDEPTIFIRLATIPEKDGGTDTSTTTIHEISDNLKALGVHKILVVETIDDDKGFILANLNHASGASEMMLLFTSRNLNNPSGPITHVFTAYAAPADWEGYYPIVRAMLAKWVALDYTPLGGELPGNPIQGEDHD